jgi:hypothetical protein
LNSLWTPRTREPEPVKDTFAAKPALAAFYADLDPTNRFNPGIGRMSRHRHYQQVKADPEEQETRVMADYCGAILRLAAKHRSATALDVLDANVRDVCRR